jgi:cell division septation protein DedD
MSDQGFHEIQLTGKQLVFLFMAAVVLAVSIFLLGVSVGRGVRSSAATAADAGAPGDTVASASAPSANVTGADLDYGQKLQSAPPAGGGAAGAAGAAAGMAAGAAATSSATKPVDPPQPPPEMPPDTGKKPDLTVMAGDPAAGKTTPPKSTPTPTPAKPATTPAPPAPKSGTPAAGSTTTSKPPAADAGWIVQLNAFSTKGAADSFIKELKGKGYTAYSVSTATLFKVRIGPFANHADADKMASRLVKDGYKPLVTR